jgi:hypothetical protein
VTCGAATTTSFLDATTGFSSGSATTTPPSADFKVIPVQGYTLVLIIRNAKLMAMIIFIFLLY